MALNCLEEAFKGRIEAEFPSRRVTAGRCAHKFLRPTTFSLTLLASRTESAQAGSAMTAAM